MYDRAGVSVVDDSEIFYFFRYQKSINVLLINMKGEIPIIEALSRNYWQTPQPSNPKEKLLLWKFYFFFLIRKMKYDENIKQAFLVSGKFGLANFNV
jgi:hypothetical protein